jgi:hypothetical protein
MSRKHPIFEQDLIDLEFEKIFVANHESGLAEDYYYYCYEPFGPQRICLLSNADDEANVNKWIVDVFTENIYFDEIEPLTDFINALKHAKQNGD